MVMLHIDESQKPTVTTTTPSSGGNDTVKSSTFFTNCNDGHQGAISLTAFGNSCSDDDGGGDSSSATKVHIKTPPLVLGWMASEIEQSATHRDDGDEYQKRIHSPYWSALQNLYRKSKVHRQTLHRDLWLWEWTRGSSCVNTCSTNSQLLSDVAWFWARVRFLERCWGDTKHFRPFDTIEASKEFLARSPDANFVVRLSSTKPGSITLSERVSRVPFKVVHTRFWINQESMIQYGDICFPNVCQFSTEWSIRQFKQERVMKVPGEYVRLEM